MLGRWGDGLLRSVWIRRRPAWRWRHPWGNRPCGSGGTAVRLLRPSPKTAQSRPWLQQPRAKARPSPTLRPAVRLLRPLAIATKTAAAAVRSPLQQRRHPRAQPCPSPTVRLAVRLLRQETVRRSPPKTAAAASQDRLQQRRSPRAKSSRPSTRLLTRPCRSTPPATTTRCTSRRVVLAAFGSTG